MNRFAVRTLRILTFAYPADFRRRYIDDITQLAIDRHRHDHVSAWRILADETADTLRTAPLQRWETTMGRIIIISTIAAAALIAALVAQVMLVPLVLVLAACAVAFSRGRRPIAADQPRHRWVPWLVAGVVGVGAAVAIPLIDGGELNAFWWSAMALAGILGIVALIASLLMALDGRTGRTTTAPIG